MQPTSRPLTAKDYDVVVFAGERETNDVRAIRREVALRVLPALRDAEADQHNWRRSPMRDLLERLPLDPVNLEATASAIAPAVNQLTKDNNVAKLVLSVSDRTAGVRRACTGLPVARWAACRRPGPRGSRPALCPAARLAAALGLGLRPAARVMPLASVSLGIIPFTAQRTVWPLEAFYVHDDTTAVVETLTAEIKVTQPRDVADYAKAFAGLAEMAVYGAAARALIQAAIDALE
ncbi:MULTISPECIES: Scr1 family TA system antitoxin-like transcriptional regulator [Streptomyces]|nr:MULTISPECIES: Scr1 family TA system antitoxin-like transcriptional regulator [Streptomyces]